MGNALRFPFIWDNHACLPLSDMAVQLDRLAVYRDAGVRIVSVNVGYGAMSAQTVLANLHGARRWLADHAEHYRLISTADEAGSPDDRRLGVVFDIEGLDSLASQVELIDAFHDLGVRWLSLAYNASNALAGGCLDEDNGLTRAGRLVIEKLNAAGVVLCLSHVGERSSLEAIEASAKPVIFSHSNPARCHPHPRNISDRQIGACAARGGVIGINGISVFLGTRQEMVEACVDQLITLVDLVGPEYVGLGLDHVLDPSDLGPVLKSFPGLMVDDAAVETVPPTAIADIAERLSQRGLSDKAIIGILGENWLRIARACWHAPQRQELLVP